MLFITHYNMKTPHITQKNYLKIYEKLKIIKKMILYVDMIGNLETKVYIGTAYWNIEI